MNKTTAEKEPLYSTCEVGMNVIACGPPRGVYHRRGSAAERRDSAVRAIWAHQKRATATEGTPA